MLNFIKTAIITILVSFISGLLLDYFHNLAPRILCNVRNGIPIHINNKKFCAYFITVSNTSNKTIHELTLNIQSTQANLKSIDAKITKGLKFDSSIKDNFLDFYIPFLCKGDEFSVTVYEDNQYAVHNKPVIAIRSPENFKEITSAEQNGILSLLSNIPKNINEIITNIIKKDEPITFNEKDDYPIFINNAAGAEQTISNKNREVPYGNKKLSKNEKAMIIIVSIVLVVIATALAKSCVEGAFTNAPASSVNPTVTKQSNDSTGITGNSDTKSSSENSSRNSAAKSSSENLSRNSGAKSSSENLSRNSAANSSSENLSRNSAANSSSENSSGNSAANSSSKNLSGNSAANSSSKNLSENSAANSSSKNLSGNSAANSSSENSTGNSGN